MIIVTPRSARDVELSGPVTLLHTGTTGDAVRCCVVRCAACWCLGHGKMCVRACVCACVWCLEHGRHGFEAGKVAKVRRSLQLWVVVVIMVLAALVVGVQHHSQARAVKWRGE